MALALEARALADDILIGDTPKARRRAGRIDHTAAAGRVWKHSRLCDIDGLVSQTMMSEAVVFTMVRNPWDRVVSLYYWLKSQNFDHAAVGRAKALPFGAFVADPAIEAMLRAETVTGYTTDAAGNERLDAVVRFEQLEKDLPKLKRRLGIPLADFPHVNRSDRPVEYQPLYDTITRSRIADYYAEDVARFGYQF